MCAKALSLGQQAGAHLTFLNGLAIRDVIIDGCASFKSFCTAVPSPIWGTPASSAHMASALGNTGLSMKQRELKSCASVRLRWL